MHKSPKPNLADEISLGGEETRVNGLFGMSIASLGPDLYERFGENYGLLHLRGVYGDV